MNRNFIEKLCKKLVLNSLLDGENSYFCNPERENTPP
jgi:hypothetical protein